MPAARLPSPGPSYIREETVRLRAAADASPREVRLGVSEPSVMEDGWWLAHLWVADDGGIVEARDIAPAAGPPPDPPLLVLGPSLAGALSGLLAQEEGRQMIRLRLPPAPDEGRPWERPLVLWVALKWDPVRASVMRPNELARELLQGFARAVHAAGHPSH